MSIADFISSLEEFTNYLNLSLQLQLPLLFTINSQLATEWQLFCSSTEWLWWTCLVVYV